MSSSTISEIGRFVNSAMLSANDNTVTSAVRMDDPIGVQEFVFEALTQADAETLQTVTGWSVDRWIEALHDVAAACDRDTSIGIAWYVWKGIGRPCAGDVSWPACFFDLALADVKAQESLCLVKAYAALAAHYYNGQADVPFTMTVSQDSATWTYAVKPAPAPKPAPGAIPAQ